MSKKGISNHRLTTGLIVAVWLCVTLFLLESVGIHSGWPAFLTLMFFTISGGKMEKLKDIFLGGAAGLIMARLLVVGVEVLVPMGLAMRLSIFIMVFITVFLLIILEDISHMIFNSYSFGYFTVALVPAQQSTIEWLLTLFIGGAFFVGGIIIISRSLAKLKAAKLGKVEEA